MQIPSARGRRGVDAPAEDDEANIERLQFVDHRDQVAEAATDPIEAPADHVLEPPPLRRAEHAVQRRPRVKGAVEAAVDVLLRLPLSAPDVVVQLGQPVRGLLVEGGDARVNRGPHASTPASMHE